MWVNLLYLLNHLKSYLYPLYKSTIAVVMDDVDGWYRFDKNTDDDFSGVFSER